MDIEKKLSTLSQSCIYFKLLKILAIKKQGEKKQCRKKPVQSSKKDGWQYMDIPLQGMLEHTLWNLKSSTALSH